MTEIERLKRKIDLKFQYIILLGDKIDETREEIRALQGELADLHRQQPRTQRSKIFDSSIPFAITPTITRREG